MNRYSGFLELVRNRQSERGYLEKPVEKEKLLRCMEAARLAPSACNSQPWKFIVVDNPELKNKIAQNTSDKILSLNHFSIQAPVLIVVVLEKMNMSAKFGSIVKNKQYNLIDLGIAVEHFCLQAVEEELGTCIMGWFKEKNVKKNLNIPFNKRAILIIALGYPSSESIRDKKRKELKEIVSYNSY